MSVCLNFLHTLDKLGQQQNECHVQCVQSSTVQCSTAQSNQCSTLQLFLTVANCYIYTQNPGMPLPVLIVHTSHKSYNRSEGKI